MSDEELMGEFSFAAGTPVRSEHRLSVVPGTETLIPIIAMGKMIYPHNMWGFCIHYRSEMVFCQAKVYNFA